MLLVEKFFWCKKSQRRKSLDEKIKIKALRFIENINE
jgi:hypothetical protein